MAEFCLKCFNEIHEMNTKEYEVLLGDDFCEHCADWKPCVIRFRRTNFSKKIKKIQYKIRDTLKSKRGSVFVKTGVIIYVVLIFTMGVVEFSKGVFILNGVNEHVTNSIVSVATDNVENIYRGSREMEALPLNLSGISFENMVDTKDVFEHLRDNLYLTEVNSQTLAKYKNSTGALTYEISNVVVEYVTSTENTASFETTYDIKIPLYFGNTKLTEANLSRTQYSTFSKNY